MQLWAIWCAHCQYTCSFGLLGMRIISIHAALGLVRSLSVYVQLWAVRYAHYKYACSFGLFGALTVSIRAALGCFVHPLAVRVYNGATRTKHLDPRERDDGGDVHEHGGNCALDTRRHAHHVPAGRGHTPQRHRLVARQRL